MEQQLQDMNMRDMDDIRDMDVDFVVGFNGAVTSGLQVHPDRQHLIYPLGCAVVIEDISTGKTELLTGHTHYVTCIAVSNEEGKMLASGQKTYMGFKAEVYVWDYATRQKMYFLELHKNNIQALVFSPHDKYLASLGGSDDGSVVIWDMKRGEAICGSPAQVNSAGNTLCIAFSKTDDKVFVTGGESTLRVWTLDVENRKIRPDDVNMGQFKRTVQCLSMDDANSQYFYCGTTTGDILAINMTSKRFQYKTPDKLNAQKGVTALAHLKNNNFLVGSGCGTLSELKFPVPAEGEKTPPGKTRVVREWKNGSAGREKDASEKGRKNEKKYNTEAAITSISLRGAGHQFFVGMDDGGMYKFSYESSNKGSSPTFDTCDLIKTSHSSVVNDVVFPPASSELILTCQKEQVRIWTTKPPVRELKRYIVANKDCHTVCLAADGQAVVSAWDDGIIRVCNFSSKMGNNLVTLAEIENGHKHGVTALACTNHGASSFGWNFHIISGGGEGQVRIWNFNWNGRDAPTHKLIENLKEHKGKVSSIKINQKNNECVSSSMDGTCIIWNLLSRSRKQMILANTLFKGVMYDAQECQIITCGTDRKIGYWDCHDGSLIRDVEGAQTGSVNSMDLSPDGRYFVTGGDDKLLKVWTYEEGNVVAVGKGHSAAITKVKICPRQRLIASVSEDGAIVFWQFPNLK